MIQQYPYCFFNTNKSFKLSNFSKCIQFDVPAANFGGLLKPHKDWVRSLNLANSQWGLNQKPSTFNAMNPLSYLSPLLR